MKKELIILGLSYSQSQIGSYVLVLSEVGGKRKLPIIIKPNDAQYIAMKIEGLSTPRPMTQDLVKKLTDPFGIDIQSIYIHNVLEGIFYVRIIASNMVDDIEVECSIGDAVALSLSYRCPILCAEEVLKSSGIIMEDDGSITEDQNEINHRDRDVTGGVTIENLQKMMNNAVVNEEYEVAAQLRNRIAQMESDIKNENV